MPASEIRQAAASRAALDAAGRMAGFRFVALDLAGFASGRLNVLLQTQFMQRDKLAPRLRKRR